MRKYFAYIIDGNKEQNRPTGDTISREEPFPVNKGEEMDVEYLKKDSGETYTITLLGLGYKDFEDEDKYKDKIHDVIKDKLEEQEVQ